MFELRAKVVVLLVAVTLLSYYTSNVSSFTAVPTSSAKFKFLPSSSSSSFINQYRTTTTTTTSLPSAIVPIGDECLFTPEGYGFSSQMERVLRKSMVENSGYYRASADDTVADVVEKITQLSDLNQPDVALVFSNDDKLLGIFTERDFIKFSSTRATMASSEEEAASFLLRPINEFVTPIETIVAITEKSTASQAIVAMQERNIRHILVADAVSKDFIMLKDSLVKGVVSMQDVMSLVQKDERLNLSSLQKKYPGLSSPMSQFREQMKSDANKAASNPETAKDDVIRIGAATAFLASCGIFLSQSGWLHDHAQLAMIAIFIAGYAGIIFEEVFELNKAGIALLMSTALWVTYADFYQSPGIASESVLDQLKEQLSEVSEICFFLLAASAIVEVVDAHQGFKVVTNQITTKSKKTLFWVIGFLTFFLSAILNNLTVTIVMVSLLRKIIADDDDRRLFGAMVVVAANAGGVWTPIGDVTTTMLWINHQLSTIPTVTELFLPSVACLVGSLFFLVNQVEEDNSLEKSGLAEPTPLAARGTLVFWAGIASLLAVPIFSELTGLPPYLAMLTGLGAIWGLTDVIHMGEEDESKENLKVPAALSKLDTSGILFFLGILMSIGVLDKSGLLKDLAIFLNENLPNQDIIATVIGIASALIDNVPLVAATMGMYDLTEFGTDDKLWQLIALCAGTGGSILVIGSASGVALMGLEKVDFLVSFSSFIPDNYLLYI